MVPVRFHQKAVVCNQEGKFLILKRAYTNKKWDLPGGAVEIPEEHEAALRREIKEEAGLEVRDIKPVELQTVYGDDKSYTIFAGFACNAMSTEVTLSHEHTDFKWVTKDEFANTDATPYLKDFVDKCIS